MLPGSVNQWFEKNLLKPILGALSIFVTLGILFCTLWPFNPFPANKVIWLTQSDGLRFDWAGVVLSPPAVAQESDSPLNGSCSLEIWLTPSETQYVYTVLDFYQPRNPWRFRLRQYHDGLIISRDSRDVEGRLRRTKVDLDHGLQRRKLTLITITSLENRSSLYLDGKLKKAYPNFRITTDDLSGQIILGTAPVDSEPWPGEIHGLAIYSKALTASQVLAHYENWTHADSAKSPDLTGSIARFPFTERTGSEIHDQVSGRAELEIPRTFQVPHKAFLTLPWREFAWSWSYFTDLLRNIAGFVPFGLFVCAYFSFARHSHKAALLTILAGGTLSFCVEILQAYIPQRVSGTTDIVTNTLGTVVGVILVQSTYVQEILKKNGPCPQS